jgi:hypothetical protein
MFTVRRENVLGRGLFKGKKCGVVLGEGML